MSELQRFCVQHQWFFSRREDGSVVIQYWDMVGDQYLADHPTPTLELTIDPDGWASVVSHVSAHGDHEPFFSEALKFHNGEEK